MKLFGFSVAKNQLNTQCCQNSQKMLDWRLQKNRPSAFTSQECVQFFLDQLDGLLWPHSLQTKVKRFFASTGWFFLTCSFWRLNKYKHGKKIWKNYFCWKKFNVFSPTYWTYKFGEVSMNHQKVLENGKYLFEPRTLTYPKIGQIIFFNF